VIKGGDSNDGTLECLNQSFQPTSFLKGGGGNDKVYGGGGDDCLSGGPGNDKLFGQAGNDIMFADPGTDTLNGGGNGNPLKDPTQLGDTASFVFLASAVTANLTTGHATSTTGGTDTLTDVENLFGTALADTLTGNSASALPNGPVNGLEGGPGADTIDGNGGAFEIGAYLLAPSAVTVTSSGPGTLKGLAGTSSGGEGSDTLDNLTGVAGSNFDDTLTWGVIIFGGAGNDTITAIAGSLMISAGTGNDTVNGSGFNDNISGDGGNDTINGNAGNDHLDGDTGGVNIGTNDTGDGGAGTDTCLDFEVGPTNCE
jgi:Ca2+-binding RTX toxin-like protein